MTSGLVKSLELKSNSTEPESTERNCSTRRASALRLSNLHPFTTKRRKDQNMSDNDKTYNGWKNYETWLVKLWQDNEQGEQEFWRDRAEYCVKVDGKESAVRSLSDIMKEHYEEASGELAGVTGFWSDLMGAALSEVNWREIAEHWIEEAIEALTSEGVEIED